MAFHHHHHRHHHYHHRHRWMWLLLWCSMISLLVFIQFFFLFRYHNGIGNTTSSPTTTDTTRSTTTATAATPRNYTTSSSVLYSVASSSPSLSLSNRGQIKPHYNHPEEGKEEEYQENEIQLRHGGVLPSPPPPVEESISSLSSLSRNKIIVPSSSYSSSSCGFEHGIGRFEGNIQGGNWTWTPTQCSHRYRNYIQLIKDDQLQQQQQLLLQSSSSSSRHPPPRRPLFRKPLQIISIGDSLSRNQIIQFCQATKFHNIIQPSQQQEQQEQRFDHPSPSTSSSPSSTITTVKTNSTISSSSSSSRNIAKYNSFNIQLCHNVDSSISIGFLTIFGMKYTCWISNSQQIDNRIFSTTSKRIETLLQSEVINQFYNPTSTNNNHHNNNKKKNITETTTTTTTQRQTTRTIFLVHSSLWDLSQDCNNQLDLSLEYAQEYVNGILEVYTTLQRIIMTTTHPHQKKEKEKEEENNTSPSSSSSSNNSIIYWRTAPPIAKQYHNKALHQKGGRTRTNLARLNQLLIQTVTKYQLGIVIDWWEQITGEIQQQQQQQQRAATGRRRREREKENEKGSSVVQQISPSFMLPSNATIENFHFLLSEEILTQFIPDGSHYKPGPSLAAYNLFLNTVFDHEPELL